MRPPPRSTPTYTLFPDTTLFRSPLDQCHNRQVTQVFPFIWMQRQRRDPCRLLLHLFGKGERNSVFVNGDQTETSGGEGVTQDIRDSRGDARQPPCRQIGRAHV